MALIVSNYNARKIALIHNNYAQRVMNQKRSGELKSDCTYYILKEIESILEILGIPVEDDGFVKLD